MSSVKLVASMLDRCDLRKCNRINESGRVGVGDTRPESGIGWDPSPISFLYFPDFLSKGV